MRIKYYSSVGAVYLKQSIQTGLEYSVSLIGWLFSNLIQFGVGFATIKFVVEQFGSLKGWGFEELAFLYGLSVLSHGLSITLFIQTWFMGNLVVNGEFDVFLLRPLSVLFQFLFMEFNLIGITDFISGIVIFVYGCIKVHFSWTLPNIISIISVIIGGTLLRGAIWLICGSVSFWSKNRGSFVGYTLTLYDKTTMFPLTIYPRLLQTIFTMIIPVGWITFYPASAFLNKEMPFYIPISVPFVTIMIGLASYMLASFIFCRGIGRYESAGS